MRQLTALPLPDSAGIVCDRLWTGQLKMLCMSQHGARASGVEVFPTKTRHALLMTGERNAAQVHQARAEARAEAEAAAEQRSAATLEQQRVELVKQARSLSCTRGARLHRLSPLHGERVCD